MSDADRTEDVASSNQSQICAADHESSLSLLPPVVDVAERMKTLVVTNLPEEENAGDTFAERAEWYYQKRPQLLALLKDLYNGYITLLDRCRNQNKLHSLKSSSEIINAASDVESDAESAISYYHHQQTVTTMRTEVSAPADIDELVAELVAKNIENDVLVNQVSEMDKVCNESRRKMELLKNLMELLESERLILVNENVKLGYTVSTVMEENKGLASEAMFMRRKASELARCVLRMRGDHRVCILSQKIEDLQEQIYGLEKRNKEYYQMLLRREQQAKDYEKSSSSISSFTSNSSSSGGGGFMKEKISAQVLLGSCFQVDDKIKLKKATSQNSNSKKKRSPSWWERVKKADLFNCGIHRSCS